MRGDEEAPKIREGPARRLPLSPREDEDQRSPAWVSVVVPWGLAPGAFAAFSNVVWAIQTQSLYGYAAILAALCAGLLWWSQWKKGAYTYTAAFLPSYIAACIATSYATYVLIIRDGTPAWLDISLNLSAFALACAFVGLIFKDPGRIPLPRVSLPTEDESDADTSSSNGTEADAESPLQRSGPHVSLSMEAIGSRESRRTPGRVVESYLSSPRTPGVSHSPPISAIKLGARTTRLSPLSTPPKFASPKHSLEVGRDHRPFELPPRVLDELLAGDGSPELHRLGETALRWGGSNLKAGKMNGTTTSLQSYEEDGVDTTPKPRPPYCHRCKAAKSARSKHCKSCNVCIDKYHHHCPALNNCVGQRNHFFFVIMLLLFILSEYFLDEAALQYFDRHRSMELPEDLTLVAENKFLAHIERMVLVSLLIVGKHPWVSSISFFARIQLLWQVPLLIFHLYCAAVNLTVHEFRNWKRCPDLYVLAPCRSGSSATVKRFVNTHTRGFANNLVAFIKSVDDTRGGF